MGKDKFPGDYVEEMTEPSGWTHLDEDLPFVRANEFLRLRNDVQETKNAVYRKGLTRRIPEWCA